MDPDRIARSAARISRDAIPECLRACDLFERCGVWTPDEAAAWREAIRARAAEPLGFESSTGSSMSRDDALMYYAVR